MHVAALRVQRFRNLAEQEWVFSPGRNVILGPNGQGKTNLLEALSVLSHTRSHRARTERELIQTGQNSALLWASILPDETPDPITLQVQWTLSGPPSGVNFGFESCPEGGPEKDAQNSRLKATFKRNGLPVRSRSAFLGDLPTVSFFYADLLLLRGTPDDRRTWLDRAAAQLNPKHLALLSEFQHIRAQKSRLLKQFSQNEASSSSVLEQLNLWNEPFALAAARLAAFRLAYLNALEGVLGAIHFDLVRSNLTGSDQLLCTQYASKDFGSNLDINLASFQQQAGCLTDLPSEASLEPLIQHLRQEYLQALERRQPDECRIAQCLVGPHRDDLVFRLNKQDAAAYGSQGQQRSIVLALKLAEWQVLRTWRHVLPVLLLDDVMAELDPRRQQDLMQRIQAEGQTQVFLTTTHLDETVQRFMTDTGMNDKTALFQVQAGQFLQEMSIVQESSQTALVCS